jgi:hypothetical protein
MSFLTVIISVLTNALASSLSMVGRIFKFLSENLRYKKEKEAKKEEKEAKGKFKNDSQTGDLADLFDSAEDIKEAVKNKKRAL